VGNNQKLKIFRIINYDKYIRKNLSAPFDLYLCIFSSNMENEIIRGFTRNFHFSQLYLDIKKCIVICNSLKVK